MSTGRAAPREERPDTGDPVREVPEAGQHGPVADDGTGELAAGRPASEDATTSAVPGPGPLPDVAALATERDEYLAALQRLQADFENYRKRVQRQQEDQVARTVGGLVAKLLPILDVLDLAQAHLAEPRPPSGTASDRAPGTASDRAPGTGSDRARGTGPQPPSRTKEAAAGEPSPARTPPEGGPVEVEALVQARSLLLDALNKEGLERIDEPDVAFDPVVHDAVGHLPAEGAAPPAGTGQPGEELAPPPATGQPAEGPVVGEILRAGYRWRGQTLRPAMVQVRG